MTSPLTLGPNLLEEPAAPGKSTLAQISGVLYITLTGLIGSMVPSSGPWAILGKSLPYIVKLVPILGWAHPSGPPGPACQFSRNSTTGWIPDRFAWHELVCYDCIRTSTSAFPTDLNYCIKRQLCDPTAPSWLHGSLCVAMIISFPLPI
ncbi:hypothetical protein DSO57_1028239 [Entomophthora muscae]|uniref:Uncharacterized protein n=1 Tax=Entomophthora muscae TaxID=34485 RepID=A0ACC2UB91_9FUNG|nr:hypothetical protein DSO57_1028239 [Entomophthora muscae]